MTKHWEAELEALKGNNAKLTAALLESTANVKQWKQQLAAYQEEAERLHKRVMFLFFSRAIDSFDQIQTRHLGNSNIFSF